MPARVCGLLSICLYVQDDSYLRVSCSGGAMRAVTVWELVCLAVCLSVFGHMLCATVEMCTCLPSCKLQACDLWDSLRASVTHAS